MSFFQWLRKRSEHYLLIDAQRRVAKRLGYPVPRARPRSLSEFFWLRMFTPVYRALPWAFRHWVMRTMPGSHRQRWSFPTRPSGPAI